MEKPGKSTLYFGFSCSYLKNELGDPPFFIAEKWLEGSSDYFSEIKMRVTKFVFEI